MVLVDFMFPVQTCFESVLTVAMNEFGQTATISTTLKPIETTTATTPAVLLQQYTNDEDDDSNKQKLRTPMKMTGRCPSYYHRSAYGAVVHALYCIWRMQWWGCAMNFMRG